MVLRSHPSVTKCHGHTCFLTFVANFVANFVGFWGIFDKVPDKVCDKVSKSSASSSPPQADLKCHTVTTA